MYEKTFFSFILLPPANLTQKETKLVLFGTPPLNSRAKKKFLISYLLKVNERQLKTLN